MAQTGPLHRLLVLDAGFAGERVEVREDADCSLSRGGPRHFEQVLVDVHASLDPLLGFVVQDEQGDPDVDRIAVVSVPGADLRDPGGCRSTAIGSPIRTSTGRSGTSCLVFSSRTGRSGAPFTSASRAAPRCQCRLPTGFDVPRGNMPRTSPAASSLPAWAIAPVSPLPRSIGKAPKASMPQRTSG